MLIALEHLGRMEIAINGGLRGVGRDDLGR
ncbi:hypothetical protein FHX03_005277 [Rhizobium sp. BK456]|nr:hypothetical protein [Rhizobium sp. BK456]